MRQVVSPVSGKCSVDKRRCCSFGTTLSVPHRQTLLGAEGQWARRANVTFAWILNVDADDAVLVLVLLSEQHQLWGTLGRNCKWSMKPWPKLLSSVAIGAAICDCLAGFWRAHTAFR